MLAFDQTRNSRARFRILPIWPHGCLQERVGPAHSPNRPSLTAPPPSLQAIQCHSGGARPWLPFAGQNMPLIRRSPIRYCSIGVPLQVLNEHLEHLSWFPPQSVAKWSCQSGVFTPNMFKLFVLALWQKRRPPNAHPKDSQGDIEAGHPAARDRCNRSTPLEAVAPKPEGAEGARFLFIRSDMPG